jgi:putative PIN family toxin of toxin-antitoxin system
MAGLTIVLDTNVLYAGLYSSRGASHAVLRAVQKRKVTMALSTTLLFEYEDVLRRHRAALKLCADGIGQLLDSLCLLAERQKVHFLWRPFLPDPKDDHILELAVASGADGIVTHNVRHFTDVGEFQVSVYTPRRLLEIVK